MTEISQRTRERTPTPSLLTKKHTKNAALKSKTRAAAELQRSTQATHTLKSLEHNLELKTQKGRRTQRNNARDRTQSQEPLLRSDPEPSTDRPCNANERQQYLLVSHRALLYSLLQVQQ